jgi:DnaJ homolog subfamily C member 11
VLSCLRFYRQARRELLEERSNIYREIEETTLLLKETARKHTQAEKGKEGMSNVIGRFPCGIERTAACEGLVVLDASYGPIDPDPEARQLVVDVTVAIQALVHKSQLYIPGHRSKVCRSRIWTL